MVVWVCVGMVIFVCWDFFCIGFLEKKFICCLGIVVLIGFFVVGGVGVKVFKCIGIDGRLVFIGVWFMDLGDGEILGIVKWDIISIVFLYIFRNCNFI